MPSTNRPPRAIKWLVRVSAGVALGLIVSLYLSGNVLPGTLRAWGLIGIFILVFVAWFESKDRDKFEEDLFDSEDDDDPRGPHGFA